jgi:hypothetical protein
VSLGYCRKQELYVYNLLLEMRAITPHVLDRIPLGKVTRAQEYIESKRLLGFLVSDEPWLLSKARAYVFKNLLIIKGVTCTVESKSYTSITYFQSLNHKKSHATCSLLLIAAFTSCTGSQHLYIDRGFGVG